MLVEPFIPFVLEPSWQKMMLDELKKPYLLTLSAFIEKEYDERIVFPPYDLIFNALHQTHYDKVQVVIVGQDPYHGKGQAHGLCFSVPEGIKPPPSLVNIYKEMQSDLGIPPAPHGCLLKWAKQEVLLLNSTLTVQEGQPLSHYGRGWELFTDALIHKLQEREDPVIFVLWGKSAQDKCRFLQATHHPILTAPHPSPFSAHTGFLGCRHFSKINTLLQQQGKPPIDWRLT